MTCVFLVHCSITKSTFMKDTLDRMANLSVTASDVPLDHAVDAPVTRHQACSTLDEPSNAYAGATFTTPVAHILLTSASDGDVFPSAIPAVINAAAHEKNSVEQVIVVEEYEETITRNLMELVIVIDDDDSTTTMNDTNVALYEAP